jgi:hypothetical protein
MIQRHALAVGQSGCYLLSILRFAEMYTGRIIDPVRAYEECLDRGWIDDDCYVVNAGAIMSHYAGGVWRARHESMDYVPSATELEIVRYELRRTMQTLAHFVVGDMAGGCGWDPYGTSETVTYGEAVSKRIFRRVS